MGEDMGEAMREGTGRVIIVSNRLPVTVKAQGDRVTVTRSSGGLATGLWGPHRESGGVWLGWPGDTSRFGKTARAEVDRQLAAERLAPVHLTHAEVEGYYEGFSNRVLWPLFHYLVDHIPAETLEWDLYRRVNEKFADAVAAQLQPGDQVWIHDYQLCLVPGLLRQRVPDARIGFFLHIPFPAPEVLQALPWRDTLLDGLLGADLIGFHTYRYQVHFADSLRVLRRLPARANRVTVRGREVRLGTYPMGIDAQTFAGAAERSEVLAEVARVRAESRGAKIFLGIDRLDYTKGIRRRLLAMERLLEQNPKLVGKVKVVQVAVPSRSSITEYAEFRSDVDEVVGRINGRFATSSWVPIHYLYRSFSQTDLVALYRAADVMLVTPLRDGMNLVAKEFAASRPDEQGVLLLSELAGAAAELTDAVQVNPYDVDGLAEAMFAALRMPSAEQTKRMRALRRRVFQWDVHRWVKAFLDDLAAPSAPLRQAAPTTTPSRRTEALVRAIAHAPSCALFLDVDGTLLPFTASPHETKADEPLRELLQDLARISGTAVHLVSGRPRDALEAWFGDLGLSLHAEHGLWSFAPGAGWSPNSRLDGEWKRSVRPLLEEWALRTPGALVEEKSAGLVWHYRQADPPHGALRAEELKERLAPQALRLGIELLEGDRIIEVRNRGVHKGMVLRHARREGRLPSVILAMGDDRTDEDLFRSLPPGSFAVHVGPRDSVASFRLADVAEARAFLRQIAEQRSVARAPVAELH